MLKVPLTLVAWIVLATWLSAGEADLQTFQSRVQPFLREHCVSCHGPTKEKAGLRLDRIGAIAATGEFADAWHEVQSRVARGEMPPKDHAAQPAAAEKAAFLAWVARELKRAETAYGGTGGKVVLRRLNRAEYRETLRELLQLHPSIDVARDVPDDDSFRGFDNIGSALHISPIQMKVYVENAANAVRLAFPAGAAPKTELLHMEPEDQADYYRMLEDLGALRRELNGVKVIQAERDRREKEVLGRAAEPDLSRAISFGFAEKKGYATDGVIFPTQANVQWASRPAGVYKFRLRLKGVANEQGDLPMVSIALTSNYENLPILTTDLTGDFQTIEAETFAQPHFARLHVRTAAMGNRYFYKRGFEAPRILLDWLEIEGPLVEHWPSKAWQEYFATATDSDAGAREVISRFAEQAFRRPPDAARIDQFMGFYRQRRQAGEDFETAVKRVMQAVLASPEFLFMIEAKAASENKQQPLDDYELTSRLSYFLWSGPPDAELYALAKAGRLRLPDALYEQARRMIEHERAARFAENFTGQWLHLRSLGQMAPDPKRYPEWEDTLQDSMRKESELFFLHVLRSDLPLTQFIDSDFAMLNGRLARFYDVAGVSGYQFRPVPLVGNRQRGGLLGQGSILTLTSDGLRTSPVKRGAFILENLLGDPPPPPPNDVPPVKETAGATLRERLKAHREMPACADCHAKIDPLGFALENFNAIGKWREREEDTRLAIDSSGVMPGGQAFEGFSDFKSLLAARGDDFARCLCEKLLTYALGRSLDFADAPLIDKIVERTQADGNKLSAMVLAIVESEAFTNK